ncbi:alcohol dehydrogenase family protein [Kiloniella sp. b19]|uniref:alcohol dehydrogenase family protein n=1 Tax=Kiloniella sp. GXU_MW_B19 TaxID=3141326 RepID=UPI0031D721CD
MSDFKIPATMTAVLLTGHGGLEKLEYRTDVTVPTPAAGEVLIRVTAAGINNTDINTRIGWYSKAVTGDTNSGGARGFESAENDDASWSGTPLQFPRIQGADVSGTVVAVGEGVDSARIGERVLVRTMMPIDDNFNCITFGSERDGGFAQYTTAPSEHTLPVNCDWSDVELASIPCAYSTAEGMLHRAGVGAERVLITGASGGVGSAAIQLAKRRGAHVIAQTAPAKADLLTELGADQTVDRNADLVEILGKESVDVVVDLVAGPKWPELLDVLVRGGRYVASGAIAGPLVELDVRTLYLKDLTLFGSTYQPREVFENLIRYIEKSEIKPFVSGSWPLSDIHKAQEAFLSKAHAGKLVLIPPSE